MFLSRNKKNNVYPCKPQFYYIIVGFKEFRIILVCFCDVISEYFTLTTLLANSAGDKLTFFFFHIRDSLHEMSKPVF